MFHLTVQSAKRRVKVAKSVNMKKRIVTSHGKRATTMDSKTNGTVMIGAAVNTETTTVMIGDPVNMDAITGTMTTSAATNGTSMIGVSTNKVATIGVEMTGTLAMVTKKMVALLN